MLRWLGLAGGWGGQRHGHWPRWLGDQPAHGRRTPAGNRFKSSALEALGVQQAHELKALVVDSGFGAAGFARLAPVVHQQALAGEAHAQSVLQHAGEELAAMVIGVAEALELEAPALCCSGAPSAI